jgi:FkbM family methyltransferase
MQVLKTEKYDHRKEHLTKEFLDNKKVVKKYILGRNKNAQYLADFVEFDGFIDDYTEERLWLNKKIYRLDEIDDKDSIIVSCSLAIYPITILNMLKKRNFKNILTYLEITKYSKNKKFIIDFLDDAKYDIESNFNKYENIYKRLKDEKSKKIFQDIINFRINRELSFMTNYKVDPIGQYFEDFLDLKENEVFIDAGGYDGQTSVEFIKHCPNYKSIYIFEPSEENILLAKENLKNYNNIHFISIGLSNKKEILKFDTTSGSASSISETGTTEILVDALDKIVNEKATFIKMDIEGAEGLALEGMSKHILNDHPKLAVSVYHKPDDFWKIPEQILAIRNDYDLYMRHYTEGTDETIMFFIPAKI